MASFLDLLHPRWKGKIVLSDPTVSGGSPNMMAALATSLGKEKAMESFRQLAAQEPIITRDYRLQLEWIARAKYPVGLGYSLALYNDLKRLGAPIKIVSFKEPRHVYGGSGTLSVFNRSAHPRATQVYVNWVLGKEASTIWSRASGFASTRVDVGTEWLDPDTVPRPEDIFPDEEQLRLRLEMRNLSARIFEQLLKSYQLESGRATPRYWLTGRRCQEGQRQFRRAGGEFDSGIPAKPLFL